MLDQLLDLVVEGLIGAGLAAFREFPYLCLAAGDEPFICVGLVSAKSLSSGMGDYLGLKTLSNGVQTELFGKRVDLELGLEVFSPFGLKAGEKACIRYGDAIRGLSDFLPEGLKMVDLSFGALQADQELEAFRCMCQFKCTAFLVAESGGQEGEFLDFVLKGTVNNGY